MWVLDSDSEKFVLKNVQFVPGFYKIFDEILVNAADNKVSIVQIFLVSFMIEMVDS